MVSRWLRVNTAVSHGYSFTVLRSHLIDLSVKFKPSKNFRAFPGRAGPCEL
jgi:hypothetical protein